jgi:archaellum biogenesis ATPase FlaH
MEQMILENRLISSIKNINDLILCQKEGITKETFVVTDPANHADVWRYIEEHAASQKRLPTQEDLKSIYGFENTGEGDLQEYISRARNAEIAAKARALLVSKADGISGEPSNAIRDIILGLSNLQSGAKRREIYLDRDSSSRLDFFNETRNTILKGGMLGLPTGLATFDKQGLGFRKGEVIVVIGGTGVGKSWLVTYMGVTSYTSGYKILMISPELTAEEVGQRFDVLLANTQGVQLSNMEIMLGKADPKVYEDWLSSLDGNSRFVVIDSSDTGKRLTFTDIWRYAKEHNPDLLIVDGLPFIAGNNSRDKGWEALKDGVEYLKALAVQEKIVVLIAHQPNRDASKHHATVAPGLDKIGYSFAVAEAADRVISMARVPGREMYRQYIVPKIRAGATIADERTLFFDVDVGNIREETAAEKYAPDDF